MMRSSAAGSMAQGENQRRDKRTLSAVVIQAFIGQRLEVELKSDIRLVGILDDVDQYMNMTLGHCSGLYCEGSKRGQKLPSTELMFVTGRKIRFVHFPEERDVLQQMLEAWQRRKQGTKARQWIVDRKRSKHVDG